MITNEGVISRGRGIAADVEESGSLPSPGDNLANATDAVIAAYVTTARRGQGAGVRPFDAAVHAYLVCHPEAHRAAAARIVAEIITHRS